jgi:hypothetical protein
MQVWYTIVYLDILDDFYAYRTNFSFTSKELAENFVAKIPLLCTMVYFEPNRIVREKDRPIYTDLENAIKDAIDFSKYGHYDSYMYFNCVSRVLLEELNSVCKDNRIKELEETVKNLTKKNKEMEDKLKLLEN